MNRHYDHQIKEKRYTEEELNKAIQEARAQKGRTDEDFAKKRAELDRREQAADEQIARLATRYGIPLDILEYGILGKYGLSGSKGESSNIDSETQREIAIWEIAERYGADPVKLEDLNLSIEETEEMAKSGEYNKEVQMEGKSSREIYADYIRNKCPKPQPQVNEGEVKSARELFAEYYRDKEKNKQKDETETGAVKIKKSGTPFNEAIGQWPRYRPASEPKEEKTPEAENEKTD